MNPVLEGTDLTELRLMIPFPLQQLLPLKKQAQLLAQKYSFMFPTPLIFQQISAISFTDCRYIISHTLGPTPRMPVTTSMKSYILVWNPYQNHGSQWAVSLQSICFYEWVPINLHYLQLLGPNVIAFTFNYEITNYIFTLIITCHSQMSTFFRPFFCTPFPNKNLRSDNDRFLDNGDGQITLTEP